MKKNSKPVVVVTAISPEDVKDNQHRRGLGSAGANYPAKKDPADNLDSRRLGNSPIPEKVKDAKETVLRDRHEQQVKDTRHQPNTGGK